MHPQTAEGNAAPKSSAGRARLRTPASHDLDRPSPPRTTGAQVSWHRVRAARTGHTPPSSYGPCLFPRGLQQVDTRPGFSPKTGRWQVFGLTSVSRLLPVAPRLAVASRSSRDALRSALRRSRLLEYRCGAAPDSNRVPFSADGERRRHQHGHNILWGLPRRQARCSSRERALPDSRAISGD